MSNLGLRLCGSIPENCLGHSVFEIVDVLRRVCDHDRYRSPTISIVHRLRLFFFLLVSMVIASHSFMLKVSSTFSSSNQLVHVVHQLLGVVNDDDRLGEVRVHRLLKLLVGVSGAVAVSEYHQVLRLLKLPHELLHQVLLSFL